MLKKIVSGLAVVLLVLIAVVAMQPAAFRIERTLGIEAPPEAILPHIASLRAMNVWSPWVEMDPKMKIDYAGPDSGVGARSSWDGPEMGKGRLEVTGLEPPRKVEMRLEMLEPMSASNRVTFLLEPTSAGTDVTWLMEGENDFAGKLFSLLMDMDQMVGGEFAKGLASLKALVEAEATARR
jgi:hypothetical protein